MRVTAIGVEFGISLSTGDKVWIKANASMDVEMDSPTDNTDDAYEKAWNRVTKEVSDQVKNFDVVVVKNKE